MTSLPLPASPMHDVDVGNVPVVSSAAVDSCCCRYSAAVCVPGVPVVAGVPPDATVSPVVVYASFLILMFQLLETLLLLESLLLLASSLPV